MPKKSKHFNIGDNVFTRNFRVLLYEEDENTKEILDKLKNYDNYEYILHNKDVYTDEFTDKDGNIHAQGELVKPHYHIVIAQKNGKFTHTLANELGIDVNKVLPCNKLKDDLIYLVHGYDNDYSTSKYEYDINELKGTLTDKIKKWLSLKDLTTDDKALNIVSIIEDYKGFIRYSDIIKLICSNNLYSDFIRGFQLFKIIIEEHNAQVYKKYGCSMDVIDELREKGIILDE